MAVIVARIGDIQGESTLSGYEDQADAVAIRESLEVASASSAGRTRGARTVGQANHSEIELTRTKDVASPKLAQACSSGLNLGEVVITLFRTLEAGLAPYMIYTLKEVFVSRIEYETLDEQGSALHPHVSDSSEVAPPSSTGLAGAAFANLRALKGERALVRSAGWMPRSAYTNTEIERVWLSAAQVRWTYNQFTQGRQSGSVEKGWNIQTSTVLP